MQENKATQKEVSFGPETLAILWEHKGGVA